MEASGGPSREVPVVLLLGTGHEASEEAGTGWTSRGDGVTASQISDAAVALAGVRPRTCGYSCRSPRGVACGPVGEFWGVMKLGAAQSQVSLLR